MRQRASGNGIGIVGVWAGSPLSSWAPVNLSSSQNLLGRTGQYSYCCSSSTDYRYLSQRLAYSRPAASLHSTRPAAPPSGAALGGMSENLTWGVFFWEASDVGGAARAKLRGGCRFFWVPKSKTRTPSAKNERDPHSTENARRPKP